MFDIGLWELALLALLALLVLGPKRLPEVARTAGRWLGGIRRFVANVKEEFDRELQAEELTELRKLKEELNETRQLIEESSSDVLQGLTKQVEAEPPDRSLDKPPAEKSPGTPTRRKRTRAAKRAPPSKRPAAKKRHGGPKKPRS